MGVGKSILETARVLRGGLRKDVLESSASHMLRSASKASVSNKIAKEVVRRYGSSQDAAAYRAANIATHTSRAAAASGATLAAIAVKKYRDKKEADRQRQMYGW